jgi:N-acetyl-anhydromuramyl-L-alanine amidase AmpD
MRFKKIVLTANQTDPVIDMPEPLFNEAQEETIRAALNTVRAEYPIIRDRIVASAEGFLYVR